MPLQDQILSLALNKGLNTKGDPKQLPIGQLTVLQNATFLDIENIKKRDGNTALTLSLENGGSVSAGNALATFDSSLTLLDGQNLFNYSESLVKWAQPTLIYNVIGGTTYTFHSAPKVAASVSNQLIAPTAYSQIGPVSAVHSSGIALILYNKDDQQITGTGETVYCRYFDTVNGIVLAELSLDNSIPIDSYRVHVVGNNFIVLASKGASTSQTLSYLILPVTTPSSGTSTPTNFLTIDGLASNNIPLWDSANSSTHVYILYSDGSTNMKIARYDSSMTIVGSAVTVAAGVTQIAAPSVTYDSTNSQVWTTYATAPQVIHSAAYTAALVNVYANTTVTSSTISAPAIITTVALSAQVLLVLVSPIKQSLVQNNVVNVFYYNGATTTTTYSYTCFTALLASKPFLDSSGNPYVLVNYLSSSNVQNTYFLVKIEQLITATGNVHPLQIVSKLSPLTASNVQNFVLSEIAYNTALDNYMLPILSSSSELISGSNATSINFGLRLAYIELSTKIQTLLLANNLMLSGSLLHLFDGLGIAEVGFNVFPEAPVQTVTSGSNIGAGTYSYVAVFKWIDNKGNVHRSSPSLPTTVVVAAPQANTLTTAGLMLTTPYKFKTTELELYRTTNGGTTYYLIGTSVIVSSVIAINDNLSDATIVGNTQLYTTGGEVENIGPPPSDALTVYKNRLIAIDSENPLNWWYSKQIIQGSPAEFSDLFTQAMDQRGGDIEAVAVLDDKLIFFKENIIFYVIGDGPSPSGANNDFSYPQIISTDVGCSNQSSVVLLPTGLMFQSEKGIYLLDRSLQTSYIGAPVEQYNGATITSAKLTPNTTQVRLTLDSGVVLVYDYFVNQWSTFTNLNFVDSAIYNQKFSGLKSDGTVFLETVGATTDNGTAIPIGLTTGWLNFAGVQGFQRVRHFLMEAAADSVTSLSVNLSYNFNDTITQTTTIPVSSDTAPAQYRVFLNTQKCQSIKINITDSPTAPSLGVLNISNLAFNVGVKKGLSKPTAAQSYGG